MSTSAAARQGPLQGRHMSWFRSSPTSPSLVHQENCKRFMLYERKMSLAGRSKETAFNLMSVLHGRAGSAVELEAELGWKKILERLDAVFKYDALTELP